MLATKTTNLEHRQTLTQDTLSSMNILSISDHYVSNLAFELAAVL